MKKLSSAMALLLMASGCKSISHQELGSELAATTASVPDASFPHLGFAQQPSYLANNAVILTFDDGPDVENTVKVLDTLKSKGVKATFFINSNNFTDLNNDANAQALVRRMISEGHLVANHTVDHPHLPTLTATAARKELDGVEAVVAKILGQSSHPLTLIRAPFGEPFQDNDGLTLNGHDAELANVMKAKGVHVGWNLDAQEYNCQSSHQNSATDEQNCVYNTLINGLKKPGQGAYGVILMHAVHSSTAAILPKFIDYLNANGFVIKTTEDAVRGKYGKSSAEVLGGAASGGVFPPPAGTITKLTVGQTIRVVSRFSGKCLDNKDGLKTDNNPLQLWSCTPNNANQFFTVKSTHAGLYSLVNKTSGKCFDLLTGASSNANPAVQKTCSTAASQQINPVASIQSAFTFKLVSDKTCLAIKGPSLDDGASLHTWTCSADPQEQWYFVAL
ncbi:MAG: polysaccharide deacetylase family protein [Chitinophagaceae bacterium]|nr:polysaccharide deacetylase family protein [Oligoflexus sp.]